MPDTYDEILHYSRQNTIRELTPWFTNTLRGMIGNEFIRSAVFTQIYDHIIQHLVHYRENNRLSEVVIGMSGGLDSALTASLFSKSGWDVVGVTLPIHQNPEETKRGTEMCDHLGIEHINVDLSDLYDSTLRELGALIDPCLLDVDCDHATKVRRGNIRARTRMITLYNIASMRRGLVASTDNYSELMAGFWTLHGDVGDLAPIQALTKSWEVPYLAHLNNVPDSTIFATPTDGLGISNGDEAQIGCSYLEWDIMVAALKSDLLTDGLMGDEYAQSVRDTVIKRVGHTQYKRNNPANIGHALFINRI